MNEIPEEVKVLETPNGHKVLVKAYLTGKDKRAYRRTLIETGRMEGDEYAKMDAFEDYKIKIVVLDVDGKTEDVAKGIIDLPVADYEMVMSYINDAIEGELDKKKEQISDTSTKTSETENPS